MKMGKITCGICPILCNTKEHILRFT